MNRRVVHLPVRLGVGLLFAGILSACSSGGGGGSASGTTPDPAHAGQVRELYKAWLGLMPAVQSAPTALSNAIVLGIVVAQRSRHFCTDKSDAFVLLLSDFQKGSDADVPFLDLTMQLETLKFFKP